MNTYNNYGSAVAYCQRYENNCIFPIISEIVLNIFLYNERALGKRAFKFFISNRNLFTTTRYDAVQT